MQPLINLFGIKDFIPHGYCLSWSPALLWLNVLSDLLITLAYFSIPLLLVYFIRHRKDFPYPLLVILFAAFIIACGATHLLSAITIWIPVYWLDGLVKGFTAIISIATAVLMIRVIPLALSLPSPAQLQAEIQQRKIAEAALRASESKLNLILDSVDAHIYIKDCNYQYRYANQQMQRLLGKTAEDILGKTDDAFFDEPSVTALRENDRRVIELGERLKSEDIIAGKNNAINYTYLSVKQPLRYEDGSIYGLCGISTDITERRQLEDKLHKSNAFNITILDSLTAHVAVLDGQGYIITVNKAWRQFAEENCLSPFSQNFIGQNYLDACKNNFGAKANSAYNGILSVLSDQQDSFYIDYACHSPGQQRWFEMSVLPLQNSYPGVLIKHQNITERKLSEQRLIELQAMIDASLDGFFIGDMTGKFLQVNESFATMTGYTTDELLNLPPGHLSVLGSGQRKAQIEKTVAQGYDLFETRSRHKDGHIIDNEVSAVFLPESRQFYIFCRDITSRKRFERQMLKHKAMIEISLEGFWIGDIKGNFLEVNQAYANMTGYSRDELVAMNLTQLEAVENFEQIKIHIEKVIARGYDLFESMHRHKDGHLIHLEISATFLAEYQQFCVFCRDITPRKTLENELKTSEAKFRSLIEFSPLPMALNDADSNIILINPAFEKTFGYCKADIPTVTDWMALAYPDPGYRHWVNSTWLDMKAKFKQGKGSFPSLELAIRCKNSAIKTVVVTTNELDQSLPESDFAILYDITERKQIEDKVNAIFNASLEGIITVDAANIIVSSNTAVERIFGYAPEELKGCNISTLISLATTDSSAFGLCSASELADQIMEIEGLHKSGYIVPLELSKAEYSIDDKTYCTAIVRDVTLRKLQEQQAREHLNQLAHITRLGLMGEMASGMAHEVNQPLTAVSNYAQASLKLIETESPDLVKLAEILAKTKQQALRAGAIIHRMRDFIKVDSKHFSTVDLNVLLHNAANLCINEIKHTNIFPTFELQKNMPPVTVDPIQIEQVTINLIRNAIDVLGKLPPDQPRKLSIQSCLNDKKRIEVRIKDNGPGIIESDRKKILMPFYTTKTEGMGMGLSISQSIVESYGGTLYFNSTAGKGSTFYFTLPTQKMSD